MYKQSFNNFLIFYKNGIEKQTPSFGKYDIVEPGNVSERRVVPMHIPKPIYAETGKIQPPPLEPEIKNKNQIECMIHSCLLAKRILKEIKSDIKVNFLKIFYLSDINILHLLNL